MKADLLAAPEQAGKSGLGSAEFIVLIAALTSVVAFSIDAMLPALSTIGTDFQLSDANQQQYVIVAFIAAFGLSQIIFGPLADRFGRRPILFFGLSLFTLSSFAAALTSSFAVLILLRILAGIGASAVRITTNTIVRDCYEGRAMARIMSFVFTVFMIIPVVAPALGQGILAIADWHWIFVLLGTFGAVMSAWAATRLKETLALENQRPLSFTRIKAAFREILTNRMAFGYTIASTLFFGTLFSMVISIAQIIEVTFQQPDLFAVIFAFISSFLALGSFLNGRLVERFGMRGLSHRSSFAFIALSAVLCALSYFTSPSIWLALPIIALIMFNFGFIAGNFQSIAMVPLGHIAGSASSVLGLISFTGGAILGGITGQLFDGTLLPLAGAYLTYSALALVIILITERGKLFGDDD